MEKKDNTVVRNTSDEINIASLIYKEVGTLFRYFLTWRQLLLGGYFATLSAIILASKWSLTEGNKLFIPILLSGITISIIFIILEVRNNKLYRYAGSIGALIEESLKAADIGYYFQFKKNRKNDSTIRHSTIIISFYTLCAIFMLLVSLLSICGIINPESWFKSDIIIYVC